MPDCNNLLHPFQTDPGTSQHQRVADALLGNAPPIDGRKLADLLDYFVQLSRHVNYYDQALQISDWQPFFQKSTPFVLATIIKYNHENITGKFELYNKLFDKNPSAQSIRLLLHFVYYNAINRINTWHQQLVESDLPVMTVTEKLIKDKLSDPVKLFIKYANTAAQHFPVKKMDFQKLESNPVWNLTAQDLVMTDANFQSSGTTERKRLIALRNNVRDLLPAFINVIKTVAGTAETNIERSLFPLKQELQKLHTPHLGLLFAFLKLFQHLQNDLNSFTRKHLDFFYTEVLKMKPRGADADKVHIVFEIQNQLDKYLLQKGLQVKDGKDNNKAEVFFALDDEIVVNKATVSDVRTLFINNQSVYRKDYVQGLYIAPDARMADGLLLPFTGSGINSWPTVGGRLSKYTDPELKQVRSYPAARIGFILPSPVLLLNEGERTVTVNLACRMADMCEKLAASVPSATGKDCCGNREPVRPVQKNCEEEENEPITSLAVFDKVNEALQNTFFHITEALIQEAIKKGLDPLISDKIRDHFLIDTCHKPVCCENEKAYKPETIVLSGAWELFLSSQVNNDTVEKFLATIFAPQRAFKLHFSGTEKWIEPDEIAEMRMIHAAPGSEWFLLKLVMVVKAGKPAITYYDKEKLQEDFKTTLPLLKVELNESVKVLVDAGFRKGLEDNDERKCCLDRVRDFCDDYLSLYHFFGNVQLSQAGPLQTNIHVKVCGLKNFVVQNDEALMNVNSPVYPFGTRPKIIDFNIDDPPRVGDGVVRNLRGPNFYVGSKEIFSKSWQNICMRVDWKDMPESFNKYYTAYIKRTGPPEILGLNKEDFEVNLSVLENGKWEKEAQEKGPLLNRTTKQNPFTTDFNRKLFAAETCSNGCAATTHTNRFFIEYADFGTPRERTYIAPGEKLDSLTTATRNGFLRFNLQNQDFLHQEYAFVLSRQMMALSQFPQGKGLEGAVYIGSGNSVIVFKDTGQLIVDILQRMEDLKKITDDAQKNVESIKTGVTETLDLTDPTDVITLAEYQAKLATPIFDADNNTDGAFQQAQDLLDKVNELKLILSIFKPGTNELKDDLSVPIPNEPWTPIISNISLDYTATADISEIDFIHLYPYKGTFKHEEIELEPALVPTFCEEGNLFIGLTKLVPGSNLNILFQLAEATADSESEREEIKWHYLDNNTWKELRNGFNILDDATNGLTTSGIVKLALPERMSNDNTVLPAGLHWIRASIRKNSQSVSETVGIHTQAIRATFTNEAINDKMRLAQPLAAESISKLKEADTAVKKVSQLYESFDGRIPEIEGQYYVRVSELLRHKGRAIQKFDYERMVLEAFPQLLKAKCINHSYALNAHQYKNDFPIAPGYILLAVLPDLNKLKAPQSMEPKVPVSLLEKIEDYLIKRTSPFVRLRAMNARYEKANFCLTVKLYPGKDETYYKEKLQQDIREFLAPWAIGQYDQLSFGQAINRSDIIRFLETRDYLDYLLELSMEHEANGMPRPDIIEIFPKTPRSILIAGHVEVCIQQGDCEKWDQQIKCGNAPQAIMDYCKNDGPIIN